MSLFWKRDKQNYNRRQALGATPILHNDVEVLPIADGNVALRARISRTGGFLDRFRPRVDHRKYELDEFGTAVVKQIDNKRKVSDIINEFHAEFGLSRRESELGVVAFLKLLMKRGLISIVTLDD